MGTIVLILTILMMVSGFFLAIKGAFWLVDECYKDKPFGINPKKVAPRLEIPPRPKYRKIPPRPKY